MIDRILLWRLSSRIALAQSRTILQMYSDSEVGSVRAACICSLLIEESEY